MTTDAFIFDAIRTPRGKGKKDGSLHTIKPVDLVVGLIDALAERNGQAIKQMADDVVLGCVTPVGDGGADVAKTAALAAGMADTVAGVQLNRFCARQHGRVVRCVMPKSLPPQTNTAWPWCLRECVISVTKQQPLKAWLSKPFLF